MKASGNGKSLCHEAEEYYYALLCHDDVAVPEAIARHVESCSFCLQQIHRLRDMLSQAGDPADPSGGPGDEGALEALSRQFEFLGEPVRCSHVKAFLPELPVPSPPVRIPTPITVHVENCPRCTQDLASIRELGLTAGQLRRLGRLYDQSPIHGPSPDEHTYATAAALAVLSLDGTAPEDLDHVSRCPQCRAWMHRQRAHAIAGLEAGTEGSGVLECGEIAMADLFDYVMPFGLDAAAVGRADGRRDAVVTHVRACRRCMAKVQWLHRTVYEIADRTDSAVCTLCECDDGAEDACEEARIAGYHYPINVTILQSEPAPVAGGPVPAPKGPRQRRRTRSKARPFFRRTAIATAGAVAVALLFLVKAPTAMGVSVGDLARAITANVHIVSRRPNNPEPVYEMWVSKDLKKVARKVNREWVEYDLNEGLVRLNYPGREAGTPSAMAPIQLDRARMFLNKPLGDIFTDDLSDAGLSPVGRAASPDRPDVLLSVYELTQETVSLNGVVIRKHWRVSVDPQQRPVEIAISRWDSLEHEWKSESVMRLAYPTTREMENLFKALSAAE
jgi:hypothetical protein